MRDLKTSFMLKSAVIDWAKQRMEQYKEGKIHAMDCILPIYQAFEDLNKIENMELLIKEKQ